MLFTVYHNNELPSLMAKAAQAAKAFPDGFKKVAVVDADNIDEVFRITNHIDEAWYGNPEVKELFDKGRSTSVGDVVVEENGTAHYCAAFGWEQMEEVTV